ncbi:uncharacterized protein LOC134420058 isoform X2 [Melospiza melodia melodia]|uniref:uncharacterized protein LOC134420058 isoform X2 n=1 Tax=Melospiza melodia melodia TaxID=1914991 RepID=UPI002FD56B48
MLLRPIWIISPSDTEVLQLMKESVALVHAGRPVHEVEELTRSFYVVAEALLWDSSNDGWMNRIHFRLGSQRNMRIYTSEIGVNGIEGIPWRILNSPSSCFRKDEDLL